jgi:Tol biopolymer transport system component
MRMRTLLTALTALAAIATALSAMPAAAKVPGPNGRIVFSRYDPAADDNFTYTANPDGSNPQPLFPAFHSGSAHWSPDGTEVAVTSGLDSPCCIGHTVIINPDTGAYRVITPEGPPAGGPQATYPGPATYCSIWSPDASHFACEGGSDGDPSVNGVYTVRSSDGGGLKRITNAGGASDIPIDYSPDGTRIVFARSINHNCDGKSALYVVNVDGTGLHRITPWGFCDDVGSWSPDGTKIAFVSGQLLGRIYVVHPDGTGLMQLPIPVRSESGLADVSWSPDGTKIAFSLGTRSGLNGIYTANANGTDLQQVTSSPTRDHQVDWGPHPLVP